MPLSEADFERAYIVVGRFLHSWAIMESSLNRLLAKVLHLEDLQGIIVAKNIGFSHKIHIIGAALHFIPIKDERRQEFRKELEKLKNLSGDRNMCAHDYFSPVEGSDGIEFHRYQVKGKFGIPHIVWTNNDINAKTSEIIRFEQLISTIDSEITTAVNLSKLLKTLDKSPLEAFLPFGGGYPGLPGLLAISSNPDEDDESLE